MSGIFGGTFPPIAVSSATLPAASAALLNGQLYQLTDFRNSLWYSDGSTWNPVNGSALLYQRLGSAAVPISSLNGIGAGRIFVLPETLKIPAILLNGNRRVRISGRVRRTALAGAPATVSVSATLGTTNTVSDQSVTTQSVNATLNQDLSIEGFASLDSQNRFNRQGFQGWNLQNVTSFIDQTLNVNWIVDNYINFGINSAAIAGDTFSLFAYSVWIEN